MKHYRSSNLRSSRPNYGFSLNPYDYFDVPNLLEYLPDTVLEYLDEQGILTERQLKDVLDKQSNDWDIINKKLITTKNIFQWWSIQFKLLYQQPLTGESDKVVEKYEKFADLLKGYSLQEPENITNFALMKDTNFYIYKIGLYFFPRKKDLINMLFEQCKSQLNLDGSTKPYGDYDNEMYKENRSLLLKLQFKRGLIIAIPTVSLIGILLYFKNK